MSDITSIDLPVDSALHRLRAPEDFLDCYSVAADMPVRQAAEIITAFPGWVRGLLNLRTVMVAPFGLLAEGPEAADKIGPFPVTSQTETEIIAGFDDKHLDFRVSVRSDAGRVSLATWVHRNNLGGRLYLALIMPFHILVAKNALRRVARHSD